MVSGNQLASHLKQQRSRIQGMLSPGRRDRSGGGVDAPLSPVQSDFAGRKFLLAAKKMRVLGDNKISSMFSRSERSLSTEIVDKFQGVESIIHLNSKTIRDGSIWPDVETTLPGSSKSVQQPAGPEAGGMLQQGSVIQKFSTVPKPGQPLESFRQQIESQPRPARPSAVQPKKAVISPGDRLFSRVQEITSTQRAAGHDGVETAVATERPVETRLSESEPVKSTDKPMVQKQSELPATVQRQIDQLVVEKQPGEVAKKHEKESEAETRERVPISEVPVQENLPEVQESAPVSEVPVQENSPEAVAVAKPSPFISAPVAPLVQKAFPAEKKSEQKAKIKKAVPVKNDKGAVNKPIVKQARPVVQSTVQREESTGVQRQSLDSLKSAPAKPITTAHVPHKAPSEGAANAGKLQSQGVQSAPPGVALPKKSEVPDMPIMLPKQGVDGAPVIEEDAARNMDMETNVSGIVQEKETGSTMPLRQVLVERRRSAERAIHRSEPVKLQQRQRPKLTHLADPMIGMQKNSHKEVSNPAAEMPAARQVDSATQVGGQQSISAMAPTPPAEFQAMEVTERDDAKNDLLMPVAETKINPKKKEQAERRDVQTQNTQPPTRKSRPGPEITTMANVVQRQWEEHSGVEGQGSGGASSQGTDDNGDSSPLDLEALAEDVFPYVKRILEIESNRISGNFR